MILLVTLMVGVFTSPGLNKVSADLLPDSTSEMSSIAYVSPTSVSKLGSPAELDLTTLENTPIVANAYLSVAYSATPVAASTVSKTPNFTITVRNDSAIVKSPSYSDIYRFKNLIYAHNSANLFGSLSSYSYGNIFSITENGITSTYRVREARIFKKIDNSTLHLCYNNNYSDCHGTNQLTQIATNSAYINESLSLSKYSIALMTCSGTSYGNGDASHRLIIFADQI